MKAIKVRGGFPLRCANLPPDNVLGLYVEDVDGFRRLMEQFQDEAEKLAPLIHETYLASLTAEQRAEQGGRPLAREWNESDAEIADPNTIAARRVPDVLKTAGYRLEPGPIGPGAVIAFSNSDVEVMAKAEHRGWKENKRIEGWSYRHYRNNAALHHLLKPYEDLTETDKNQDPIVVRHYPELVRSVGYRIVKGVGGRMVRACITRQTHPGHASLPIGVLVSSA